MGNVQLRLSHVGRDLLFKTSDYFTGNLVDVFNIYVFSIVRVHRKSSSDTKKIKQPYSAKREISPASQYPALTLTWSIDTERIQVGTVQSGLS